MDELLENFYKLDLYIGTYYDRKISLETNKNYQINGITQSGKTKLIKNYLLNNCKKNSYLYIDCHDVRINIAQLNSSLKTFCIKNKINTLVLDNYIPEINIFTIPQLIIATQVHYTIFPLLQTLRLYPLDYEEFLAYEQKYDLNALNHYIQLGGLPAMHTIAADERTLYIQKILQNTLELTEFHLLCLCAQSISIKLSPFSLYEKLKQTYKISKDKLYKSFENLVQKQYFHLVEKYTHPKAIKKLYLCDISLRAALSTQKHFGILFENMVFLELLKSKTVCYYADNIDFYLPQNNEIILCKPFADERRLFKKLESIEAFLVTYAIEKITVITMNKEATIAHPLSKVSIIPFDIWALGD